MNDNERKMENNFASAFLGKDVWPFSTISHWPNVDV